VKASGVWKASKKTRIAFFLFRLKHFFKKLPYYRILLYRKQANRIEPMKGNGFVNSGAKIVYNGQYFYLVDSSGEVFKNQVSCTIKDRVNEPTQAIIVVNVQSIEYREKI